MPEAQHPEAEGRFLLIQGWLELQRKKVSGQQAMIYREAKIISLSRHLSTLV